jgi:mannose-6-phosphate isomerase-like protein (cupin superfamily)
MPKRTNRPWGYFETISNDNDFKVKKIVVYPKKRLSLQKHMHRKETWVVISGKGRAETLTNGKEMWHALKPGAVVQIRQKQVHRATNLSKTKDLCFVEVQTGKVLAESDIIRLEDDFGRAR